MSLTTLLQHCADGDADAIRQLYELQAARLHGIALRITGQPALAADVVHDAFLSVWQFASTFDPARGTAEAWLTSVIRYRALDAVRRPRQDPAPEPEDPAERVDNEPDPFYRLQAHAETAALYRRLAELEPDERRFLALAFLDGLTYTQLAQKLAAPPSTVRAGIRRALALLSEFYK